jgi:hypothetical protein
MISLLVLAVALAMAGGASALNAEDEVLAAMYTRKHAMLTRDRADLEKIYAPTIVYVHSNGKQENKIEAIEAAVNGKDVYVSIDLNDIAVSFYEKAAIVRVKAIFRIRSGAAINQLNLDILHVWLKTASGWQMVARHAARLNPA